MSAPRVQVRCPSCRAEYEFPERLMGPEGARVVCPACGTRFRVARLPVSGEPDVSRPPASPEPAPVAAAAPAARDERVSAMAPAAGDERVSAMAPAAGDNKRDPAMAPAAGDEWADPRNVAEWLLGPLDPERERIRRAAEAGRLLAEFGPVLVDAFDRFASSPACRTQEPRARREAFARAVRDRLGVTLPLAPEDAP
jgi:predicted Zn finger-like uncharacterized protein